jgi:hypothetical protein
VIRALIPASGPLSAPNPTPTAIDNCDHKSTAGKHIDFVSVDGGADEVESTVLVDVVQAMDKPQRMVPTTLERVVGRAG